MFMPFKVLFIYKPSRMTKFIDQENKYIEYDFSSVTLCLIVITARYSSNTVTKDPGIEQVHLLKTLYIIKLYQPRHCQHGRVPEQESYGKLKEGNCRHKIFLNELSDKKLQQHDISLTCWEPAADRANQHVTIGFRGEDIRP